MYRILFVMFALYLCIITVSCRKEVQQADKSTSSEFSENITETTKSQELTTEEYSNNVLQSEIIAQSMDISQIDFEEFEQIMDFDMWTDFKRYIPVLKDEAKFTISQEREADTYKIPPETYYLNQYFEKYSEMDNYVLKVNELTVFDLDSDGNSELIVGFDNIGRCYLVFHEENGEYTAAYFGIRQFKCLCTTGVYSGSGGAGSTYYLNITFENGKFIVHDIAQETFDDKTKCIVYVIGNKEVDEETFNIWKNENISERVKWYIPCNNGKWKYDFY